MKLLQFKEVFHLKDDDQLKDLISRVAARLVLKGLDEVIANPVALQMIDGYMQYLFNKICMENNITINTGAMNKDTDFFDIHKETKH